jgi:hypothetical protein
VHLPSNSQISCHACSNRYAKLRSRASSPPFTPCHSPS